MTQSTEWRFGKTDDLPEGPWKSEPDKVSWIDDATGLDCLIVRNRSGALCGYVGLPPGHPWHGMDYSTDALMDVGVHGGLTFADSCDENRPEGICHVPAPGRPADVWWLGFDCAHYLDMSPHELKTSMERNFKYPFTDPRLEGTYRNVAYVTAECASLAEQLARVS